MKDALSCDGLRINVLMIGPLPPPIGGVANFVYNINTHFSSTNKYNIRVIRTGKTSPSQSPLSVLLHDIGQSLRFAKEFKRYNADIVHIHTASYYSFFRNFPYMFWIKNLSKARLVVHIHGGMFREFYYGASIPVRYLVKVILRSADTVIVTSPSWINLIKEISGRKEGIHSLANGFEPTIFYPKDKQAARRELGLPDNSRILVTVGYLEKVKGHKFLIEAMPKVIEHLKDVSLFIIGSGSLKETLVDMAKELKIEGKVNFIDGGQTSEKIALWINSSDLFVLPSLNEGNPTVLFESLGCGRPFLGTRVGGIGDIIISKELGALCEPADSRGLAFNIVAMLDKRWNADYISAYAQRYSWNKISEDLAEIYERMMGADIGGNMD